MTPDNEFSMTFAGLTQDQARATMGGIMVNSVLIDWKSIEACKSMADEYAELAALANARAKFARMV